MFGYIYKITNNLNNKVYIGKREKSKFDEGYWGSGKYIKNAINKYGIENFSREILEWCADRDSLCEREAYYIDYLNTRNFEIGYNIAKGGIGGGSPHTEEWKLAHSGSGNGRFGKEVSKETRLKISTANKGKVRTTETKEKISKSLKGVKKPDGFSEKVSKFQKGRVKSNLELRHLRESRDSAASKTRGRKIYNNGVNERRFYDNDIIPDGYIKGRLKKSHTKYNLPTDYHWYNNGVKAIYCRNCPDGFVPGRKIHHEN